MANSAQLGGGNPKQIDPQGDFVYPGGRKRQGHHFTGYAVPPTGVYLTSEDASLYVSATLDATAPTMVSGYGGWESVAIPGERAEPVWRGTDVVGVQFGIVLGSLRQPRRSIAPDIDRLEKMAGLEDGFETRRPPALILYGRAVPHNAHENPNWRWVIAELAWGDPANGARGVWQRRGATITLWRLNGADALEKLKPRKTQPDVRTIESKQGDTYNKIAQRELGTYRLGPRLARFNDARDPRKKLAKGTKVRIPTKAKAQTWREDLKASEGKGPLTHFQGADDFGRPR